MNMTDVVKRYEPDLKHLEEHLGKYLHSAIPFIPTVINHLITSGGKRFRPLMLLASADLCGYRGERRYPLSAVIEFIHPATLLPDDVIDGAETRRGRPSANNVWGNAATVLVGDFLYSRSFTLMTDDGDLNIIKLISETTNTMAEGEVFQLLKRGDVGITEEDYFTHRKEDGRPHRRSLRRGRTDGRRIEGPGRGLAGVRSHHGARFPAHR
jgi:octaprenyl-diphosphate synthase